MLRAANLTFCLLSAPAMTGTSIATIAQVPYEAGVTMHEVAIYSALRIWSRDEGAGRPDVRRSTFPPDDLYHCFPAERASAMDELAIKCLFVWSLNGLVAGIAFVGALGSMACKTAHCGPSRHKDRHNCQGLWEAWTAITVVWKLGRKQRTPSAHSRAVAGNAQ